jgi:MMPL family
VAVWVILTVFGGVAAAKVSSRWFESFSIPGYSAYETNQKVLKTFGSGEQAPFVAVFHSDGDVTKANLQPALDAASRIDPGARISSYASTHNNVYVSQDRHTTFAEIYPTGENTFNGASNIGSTRAALQENVPAGVTAHLTGLNPLYDAASGGDSGGPSVLTEALIGGLGALVILMFVFGTLPAVAMPLVIALCAILNTFTLVWGLTYITDVSIVVQFLIALVGLGVAIDYALLMIFRFREELAHGEDVETALVETMTHAGRSVIVSGSTVAVGLLSMVILPLPFIRSIGIGGMLIPAVSVVVSITLLPALLSFLGHGVNRFRVMPKRFVTVSDPETSWWGRWGYFVVRRPWPVAAVGLAIVGVLLFYGFQLNPSEAQAKDFPGSGDAITGRQALTDAGISSGAIKPFIILTHADQTGQVVAAVDRVAGIDAALLAPRRPGARRGYSVVRRVEQADPRDDHTREGGSAGRREPRRRGAGGPRLRARRLRELHLRPALRDPVDVRAACARVPFAAAAAQGGDPEPDLARCRLRDHRVHLPAGARGRSDLGRPGDAVDHPVDPADDLRLPVRALNGLRGVPAHAHARGLRRDGEHARGCCAGARANRQADYQRGTRPHVRVLRPFLEPGNGHQAVRDRPRGRDHLRRNGHPWSARAVDHGPDGPLELVAPGLGGAPAAHASE